MISSQNSKLKSFQELVAMKYQVYNGLFVTLPFEKLENTETHLALFLNNLREKIEGKISPREIVEKFFEEVKSLNPENAPPDIQVLFGILQFVERQVVLFDALEEAAFEEIKDIHGPGSLENFINKCLKESKLTSLKQALNSYCIRPVLTAHPTQFYPDSVLGILSDLADAIKQNKLQEIHNLLMQMGKTRFKNRHKPTPLEEAKSLLWYLENIFYKVLPQLKLKVNNALNSEEPPESNSMLELGFWPGGDRDGNPFVKAATTQEVSRMLKTSILNLYLHDLKYLKRRLSFDGVSERLAEVENKLYKTQNVNSCSIDSSVANQAPDSYQSSEDFLLDLTSIQELLKNKHQNLFADLLQELICKVKIFGFHFATLDLRQDSRIHSAILTELLLENGYEKLTENEKTEFLPKLITSEKEPPLKAASELSIQSKDALDYLASIESIQSANGSRALNRYIISNSNSKLNVLELLSLFKISKAAQASSAKEIKIDIVPLFETIDDLESAAQIMDELYSCKVYSSHLASRGNVQTIMLGFSDGTKDGGYFSANWNIYLAKSRLTEVSQRHGIKVIFFDGRGGPPARGGGNTNEFYRSMGKEIEQEQIQLTIQGQTISSNFGSIGAASYNLEQLFTAGLERKIFADSPTDSYQEAAYSLLQEISDESLKAYLELRNDKLFVPYLEELTPLRFYDQLNFASRPSKRNKVGGLKFEDLRAISFVGAWTQMKQNIAGYYGLGSALSCLIQKGKLSELKNLYSGSLFFKTVLENAMQSLSKSYFPLTFYLEKDSKFSKFWAKLYEETKLTEDMIKQVSGQNEIMQMASVSKASILLREKIVLPLLVIQHYALCKLRELENTHEQSPEFEALQKIVVKSLAANINASRNSV